MKAMVCALALAAVLAVANCAPYESESSVVLGVSLPVAYLIPEDATVVRVARSPQFSGSAANAGAQSFNAGGFPGFGGFSGSAANAASQSFSQGGGHGGFGGLSGSAASAGAQSFSGGAGGFPGFGGFSGSAANAGAQSFSG
ncbi:hypothetical protein ZHAS_00013281 [Anopheles sinensis]|uniref:Uncharacterized protein n=1 Tax=Anopheles sinensis TaxID=74873 RepID=A0A084W538_ANOSI|nr:hypothetical protein ZHAS_00013281 [Anopheles sinensis]